MHENIADHTKPIQVDQITSTHAPIPTNLVGLVKRIWVVIALFTIGLFCAGIPARYDLLINSSPQVQQALAQIGLSPNTHAALLIGIEVILVLGFTIIGISIFLQKPRDITIAIVSLSFIAFGTSILFSTRTLSETYPQLEIWTRLAKAINWSLIIPIYFVFPNGRFAPKWTRGLTVIWLVWTWSWFFFPSLPHNPTPRGAFSNSVQFGIYLAWFATAIFAQIYRYRKVSSPNDQQQTKWVVFGFAAAVVGTFVEELPSAINPALMDDTPAGILYVLLSTTAFVLAVLSVPVSFAISIQRKRLWQIDYVINRSLVYGAATLGLGIAFITVLLFLQRFFLSITGAQQSTIAIAVSAMLIAGLFQPLRNRLQIAIDEHLYDIHIHYKPGPRVSAFTEQSHDQGERVGDYLITEHLARGGMAEIFIGRHLETQQEVAIKILLNPLAKHKEFQLRFLREAKTVANLHHPNIIKVLDFGKTGETYFLVMEYISHKTLSTLIKEQAPLQADYVINTITRIANALDYAHSQGIVHRDVKPSNVLLRQNQVGSLNHTPILTDFGIAKLITEDTHLTKTGILGTFDYIAPEQIQASDNIDGRADIYGLGIMAYQMLTGQLPFPSGQPGATLIAHLQQPPPNPKAIRPDLPETFCYNILKAMAKNPDDRYTRAGIFADSLLMS